jgi:hypothetical protein
VIAVELVTPDGDFHHATFTALRSRQETATWLKETCFLIDDGRGVDDVEFDCKQRPLSSPGKKATMYVITRPESGSQGFVCTISHALCDHYGTQIVDSFARALASDRSSTGMDATFVRENIDGALARLPKSMLKAYEEEARPTSVDMEDAWTTQCNAIERHTKVGSFWTSFLS